MRLLLGLLFVIFSLSLANAEEPTKEALLEELFQLTEATDEAILARTGKGFRTQIEASFKAKNVKLGDEHLQVIEEIFVDEFKKELPELMKEIRTLSLETYTVEELKKALELLRTPEGQRFQKKQEMLVQKLVMISVQSGMRAGKRAQPAMADYMKAHVVPKQSK
ncbi:hypothetical protein PsAD46_04280 [Pseudovibrio sp. Ad46]|uniref:DUF2059 domain-containing protein n=1 Tax=unclassified Pseudovibrio TaxID=2627060 RepID=UPI0007AE945F|nr:MULTISPECIES: hypothetical protein [unclassified Pseudovibrio]KZK79568.1 hypothetical protein PsAD46_04280 [Pseudovibrio sp. Ad46]KZK98258.1 hypothetical protein PsAD5_01628 [Pseudovibrio sp. Ad5]